jgi:hypothetical protein
MNPLAELQNTQILVDIKGKIEKLTISVGNFNTPFSVTIKINRN